MSHKEWQLDRELTEAKREIVKLKNLNNALEKAAAEQERPALFGLYIHRYTSAYECGSSSSEWLSAVDISRKALRSRFNAKNDAERAELDKRKAHESYYRNIAPNFADHKDEIKYNGGTGGGYSSVQYTVTIRPLEESLD